MFDHVKFGVSNYAASKAFFLKALEPLGVTVVSEWPPNGVELSQPKGKVSLCLYQTEEKPAHLHLAFTAENRQQVDAFYGAALEAGGKDNGAPGLRPHYHANYYAAFVIGPDGHNIEAVCHEPESVPSVVGAAASGRPPLMSNVRHRNGEAVTVLVPMSPSAFVEFQRAAIESYAKQNVASGRWPAESAMEFSRAEYQRLLPDGPATKDAHLFEIRESTTNLTVGTLWLAVQNSTGTPTGYVFNVEIAEEHRRKGYATRAFEALEPICRGLGLASVGLHVFAFNTAARRLYETLGYEVTGITMRKSLRCDDGV